MRATDTPVAAHEGRVNLEFLARPRVEVFMEIPGGVGKCRKDEHFPIGFSVTLRGKASLSGRCDCEFGRFYASVRKGNRDCNIEPPASPFAR
jgi:hypothetical protein